MTIQLKDAKELLKRLEKDYKNTVMISNKKKKLIKINSLRLEIKKLENK